MNDFDTLPDGSLFPFWDDETVYAKVYHVAALDPRASDGNPGTEAAPFVSIGRAAKQLQAGEKLVVHAGGTASACGLHAAATDRRAPVAYEAAKGEEVVITGAELWTPVAQPSAGWTLPRRPMALRCGWPTCRTQSSTAITLSVRNVYEYITQYGQLRTRLGWARHVAARMIFHNGQRLTQVLRVRDSRNAMERSGSRNPAGGAFPSARRCRAGSAPGNLRTRTDVRSSGSRVGLHPVEQLPVGTRGRSAARAAARQCQHLPRAPLDHRGLPRNAGQRSRHRHRHTELGFGARRQDRLPYRSAQPDQPVRGPADWQAPWA